MSNLEVLSLYLPYGVKIVSIIQDSVTLPMRLSNLHYCTRGDFTPILKPMESITEEVLEDYYGDVHNLQVKKLNNAMLITYEIMSEKYSDTINFRNINFTSHGLVMHLIKNHYDVFGLIPKGEAVDYYSLNKEKV